tara:strand:+ start:428 stop:799 length:372 start_codon:yes stop_codon:yes gene_type:complete
MTPPRMINTIDDWGFPPRHQLYGRNKMARYRGLRAIAGMARIKVRRSIDLREMSDFGSITSSGDDLPTSGAGHSSATGGSTGRTRGHTSMGVITGVRVDTQDFGSITTTASSGLGYNDEAYGY